MASLYKTEKEALEAVRKDGDALRFVHNQTEAICLAAVQQHPYALQYVHNQTEAICLAAVQQNSDALPYVHNQTEAICLAAVQQNSDALAYVRIQTEAICLAAVQKDRYALRYVNNQTEVICLSAVQQNAYALQYVRNKTPRIIEEAQKIAKQQNQDIDLDIPDQNLNQLRDLTTEIENLYWRKKIMDKGLELLKNQLAQQKEAVNQISDLIEELTEQEAHHFRLVRKIETQIEDYIRRFAHE